jgi:hypothetical protein
MQYILLFITVTIVKAKLTKIKHSCYVVVESKKQIEPMRALKSIRAMLFFPFHDIIILYHNIIHVCFLIIGS